MSNTWLSEKVTYLAALKKPTDAQQLLIELFQISERTPEQEKKLLTLIKAEKAIDRANQQKILVRKLLNAEKEAERKARTRHLIQLGALFEIAQLDQRNPAELLGILLKTAEIAPDDPKWDIWAEIGQNCLNERIAQNRGK
ncbi:conjugative transfer protein TraD [Acinetobacter calcoaceticus]|uniref:Conjugative transfer protein TraD n=1 Tax=Acinetobacter calcoaceticus TaxID=471 RepID=A0A4R1X7D8_ACICA|nr:conjugative transfer protein TraD [Acinetobacter calcoaceticus]